MQNQRTDYGAIIDKYVAYKQDQQNAEWRLGHQQVLRALGEISGKTILDFGCGPATFSSLLSARGAQVIGVDPSQEELEQARARDPRGDYRYYRGLLAEMLAGEKIVLIVATFSFCLIPDRELRYILRDMRQLMGPDGRLVILEPNQGRSHGVQYANLHYHRKEGVQTGDYVCVTLGSGDGAVELYDDIFRQHEDYCMLLAEAGFTVEQLEEPRPEAEWGEGWETESKYPPFLLITAR